MMVGSSEWISAWNLGMTCVEQLYINCQLDEFGDHPHSTKLVTVCSKSPQWVSSFSFSSSVWDGWWFLSPLRVNSGLLPLLHHCEGIAICWSQFYSLPFDCALSLVFSSCLLESGERKITHGWLMSGSYFWIFSLPQSLARESRSVLLGHDCLWESFHACARPSHTAWSL